MRRRSSIWIRVDVDAPGRAAAERQLDSAADQVEAYFASDPTVLGVFDDSRRYGWDPTRDDIYDDDIFDDLFDEGSDGT